jgi:hypothetical protein
MISQRLFSGSLVIMKSTVHFDSSKPTSLVALRVVSSQASGTSISPTWYLPKIRRRSVSKAGCYLYQQFLHLFVLFRFTVTAHGNL